MKEELRKKLQQRADEHMAEVLQRREMEKRKVNLKRCGEPQKTDAGML